MRSRSPRGDAPGLGGPLRTAMGALEAPLPRPVDHAIRGPVILAQGGPDAVVFPPLDACSGLWARTPRPLVIDAQRDPDN